MSTTTFDSFYSSEAYGDLAREYRAEIKALVDEAIKETADVADLPEDDDEPEAIDEEAASDFLQESIDGHQWVIYTGKAMLVVLVSDADPDDYLDEIDHPARVRTHEARAYACMIQDAADELRDRIEAQS